MIKPEHFEHINGPYITIRNGLLNKNLDIVYDCISKNGFDFFDIDHVQGYYSEYKDFLNINLVGSNEIKDWITNLTYPFKTVSGSTKEVSIHSGYYKSYQIIKESLIHKLTHTKKKKVLIYGHSFGGAVGGVCAYELSKQFKGIEFYYVASGSPKIGNCALIKDFKATVKNSVTFIYGNDIVPALPFKILGYPTHVGTDVKFVGGKRWLPINVKHHDIIPYSKEMLEYFKNEC